MVRKKRKYLAVCFVLFMTLIPSINVLHVQASVEKKKVVVGTNAEYAPFDYLDSDGNLTGFDIDLLEAIAEEANLELEWRDLPFDSLLGAMEAGDVEVIAAAVGPTEERRRSVDFSDVYYTGMQSILCQEGLEITTFEELSGKRVAVLEGSLSDTIASGESTDYGVVENAKVTRFKTAASAVMELKNGGVDAVLIDSIMAEIYCKQTSGLVQVPIEGTEEDTVFCIAKGNKELQAMINEGLAAVRENGVYDRLYSEYFSGESGSGESLLETAEGDSFFDTLQFIFVKEKRWKYYVNGLGITIIVSLAAMFVGLVIGLILAFLRLGEGTKGKKTIGSVLAGAYVDIIRGTPSVLQLLIIYFAVFHSRLGYVAAVISFGLNSGAYVSEVIRGGILAVEKGQMEAGRSLGLSYRDTMRFVVIPQAVKNILPAMGNEFILLIKETSILGYVGIVDLTKAASYVSSRTYQMFIPLLAAGILYYGIVKLLSQLLGWFERRLRESD